MSTKSESLEKSKPFQNTLREKVTGLLAELGPMSRADLAALGEMRLSSVCATVKPLLDQGVLKVFDTAFDATTQRNVERVALA